MPELRMDGCTPEPLMAYLKSLGVLRLISEDREHGDPNARGAWRDGVFVLNSRFDQASLTCFFLEQYQPTPIVAPWGARSGFYPSGAEKTARAALNSIEKSDHPRFNRFRETIISVRAVLRDLGIREKAKDEDKLKLLYACRATFPEYLLEWLDTCYVLTGTNRKYPPLLGTGGNEGSGSYASGFAQQIVACVVERQHDPALSSALFGTLNRNVFSDQTPGHFSPCAAGGPNAGQGMEGPLRTNPWDYLLCIEGACLWASGVFRRMGASGSGMAAFPFTVNVSGAGSSSLAFKDSVKPKQAKRPIAEMWLPVWSRELAINELRLILSEGRASLGRRATSNGVDFARSLSELGVDRGLSGFVRIAFLMRNGQSFLGIPLGLFEIGQREKIDLLRDYDAWLDSFRYSCRMKEQGAKNDPPPRFPAALRRIDTAVFDFCKYGGRDRTAIILAALGAAERELALGDMPKDKRRVRRPLAGLSADWIDACDDGSPEYRLARSLAFMRGDPDKTGPLRRYLEPVKLDKGWLWTERGGHVVWAGGDVFRNLGAVLVRRLMDAEIRGEDRLPLDSDFTASLADIGVLLAGEIDVQKLEDLIWGLALVTPRGAAHPHRPACVDSYLPSAYAVLKLTLLPGRLEWTAHNGTVRLQLVRPSIEEGTGIVVKPEPAILTNLHAGDVQGACEVACRRLRASGFTPLASRRPDGSRREITWSAGAVAASRLLAALLFPIERHAVNELANLVLRRPKVESLT